MIGAILEGAGRLIASVVEAGKRTPEQIAARQRARALTQAQRAFHRALKRGDPDEINAARAYLEDLARE